MCVCIKAEWAIPEKNKQGRGAHKILFKKIPKIFHYFTLPLKIPGKQSYTPGISTKLC